MEFTVVLSPWTASIRESEEYRRRSSYVLEVVCCSSGVQAESPMSSTFGPDHLHSSEHF